MVDVNVTLSMQEDSKAKEDTERSVELRSMSLQKPRVLWTQVMYEPYITRRLMILSAPKIDLMCYSAQEAADGRSAMEPCVGQRGPKSVEAWSHVSVICI